MGENRGLKSYNIEMNGNIDLFNFKANKESFLDWMVKTQGLPIDGFIVTELAECLTTMRHLDMFHEHFNNVFSKNPEYLTQCSIDFIYYIKQGKSLPYYYEN